MISMCLTTGEALKDQSTRQSSGQHLVRLLARTHSYMSRLILWPLFDSLNKPPRILHTLCFISMTDEDVSIEKRIYPFRVNIGQGST